MAGNSRPDPKRPDPKWPGPNPARRQRRRLPWPRLGRRGATSVEFALVMAPFFMMVLGLMEVSFDLYTQAALDLIAETAARNVQVGGATGVANESSATFVSKYVCPAAGQWLDCNLITVAVVPVPAGGNYYGTPVQLQLSQAQANAGQAICTGTAEQMMVLRIWYDGPTFVGLLLPAFTKQWNGAIVHETAATAGFVNEYFGGAGQTAGSACGV